MRSRACLAAAGAVALMCVACGGGQTTSTAGAGRGSANADECLELDGAGRVATLECDERVVGRAVENSPSPEGFIRLAWVRHDLALAYFARAVRGKSKDDLVKATAYARLAAYTAPSFAQFWRTLGYFSLRLEAGVATDAQALGAFQRSLSLEPDDARSRRMVARIHVAYREYEEAAEHLAYLFRTAPLSFSREQIHELVATLIAADLMAWGAEMFTAALRVDPREHDFAIAQAMLLRAEGNLRGAEAILHGLPSRGASPQQLADARALLSHWSQQ